ncbi:MAG: hypothetical protein ONB48_20760 [candidate division KSB1 bacterium]|nr:hypothetical protein [candidate division KSB1 bacterium]MDZ7276409.1 hypothetical protein [candidate division KSB1 bacterium]MDZ7288080.1 hypothetical protein [candidate division KSB1 bacterium]MDZ7300180.1 hypothetical protein [candidate division KSB1 bacterium]MDZ7305752.1 hypothetical protein [candidate division KSB1 bacterium]
MADNKRNVQAGLPAKIIWLIVVVIVIMIPGKWWLDREATDAARQTRPVPAPPVDWSQVDAAIVAVLAQARTAAETTATQKLEAWSDDLMWRVDHDFLDWYFGYWNQQKLALKALGYRVLHYIFANEPEAAARLTEEVQQEFAQRVLRPQIAQLELERITTEVLQVYLSRLTAGLAGIPAEYKIPAPEWERYLNDIAVLTTQTEGSREIALSLKAATAVSLTGGVLLAQTFRPTLQSLGSTVSGRLAGKAAGEAAAEVAVKTGGKVAARSGGKLLGLIVGFGIIIWEVWDHQQTEASERPKLRQTIADYFAEVNHSLLYDPETGIMSLIHGMEANIVASLRTQPPVPQL